MFGITKWQLDRILLRNREEDASSVRRYIFDNLNDAAKNRLSVQHNRAEFNGLKEIVSKGHTPSRVEDLRLMACWHIDMNGKESFMVKIDECHEWMDEDGYAHARKGTCSPSDLMFELPTYPMLAALQANAVIDRLNKQGEQ